MLQVADHWRCYLHYELNFWTNFAATFIHYACPDYSWFTRKYRAGAGASVGQLLASAVPFTSTELAGTVLAQHKVLGLPRTGCKSCGPYREVNFCQWVCPLVISLHFPNRQHSSTADWCSFFLVISFISVFFGLRTLTSAYKQRQHTQNKKKLVVVVFALREGCLTTLLTSSTAWAIALRRCWRRDGKWEKTEG